MQKTPKRLQKTLWQRFWYFVTKLREPILAKGQLLPRRAVIRRILMGLRFNLNRLFFRKKNVNIISDQVYEAANIELKRQGVGNVEHHNAISKNLRKIQLSYNPAVPGPKELQQFVWLNIMFYLIRPGRKNLWILTK